jgi:catechol 2,3-dioxygenase-like lactoylglutathione lyase family enzyme
VSDSKFSGLSAIKQIAVPIKDLERALAFYRDSLGMKMLFRVPNLVFFDAGGIRLMLSVPEKPEFDHPSSIIYFSVPEIQSAFKELSGKGVKFEGAPHMIAKLPTCEVWMAFFRDTENNLMAVTSEVPL